MKTRFPKEKAYLKNANWFVKIAYYAGMGYFKNDAKQCGATRYERTFQSRWWHPLYLAFGLVLISLEAIGLILERIPEFMTQSKTIYIDSSDLSDSDYDNRN